MSLPSEVTEHPELVLLREVLERLTALEEKEGGRTAAALSSKWWDIFLPIKSILPNVERWSDVIASGVVQTWQLPVTVYDGCFVNLNVRTIPDGIELSIMLNGGIFLWQKMVYYNELH